MFLRFIAAAGLICSLSASAIAQSPASRVALDSDIRIFAVAAALNAASSDGKFATDLDPDLLLRLKQYYTLHKGARSDASQFAQYVGLAVILTDPPGLQPRVREERLPDDTRALLGFGPLLREFYLKAHITQRWVDLQPQYEAEMVRLKPKISEVLLHTDAYLRTALTGTGPRQLHINAEPLAPPNSVTVRVYEDDYYVVLGPSQTSNLDDLRHAYLHFHLDDIVSRSLARIANKDKILAMVAGEQDVNKIYTKEFGLMTVESLIRAMELRIDRSTAAHAKDVVANAYRSGLLLTPYFYDALQTFQTGTTGFGDGFARMAEGINFQTEHDRFQSTFHSIPIPKRSVEEVDLSETLAELPVPADPVRKLIVEAQTAFNNMDNEGARALFQKVLRDYDSNNGAALYGLGLLASRATDVDQSKLYFERTLKSDSADAAMKVWSYIYLGRIADLQCQRDRATDYYKQAVAVGDNTRDAQASARSGLSKAFGDECR